MPLSCSGAKPTSLISYANVPHVMRVFVERSTMSLLLSLAISHLAHAHVTWKPLIFALVQGVA